MHGGAHGLERQIWDGTVLSDDADRAVVEFRLHSPDGDRGFPGAVDASVTYAITHQEITMTYDAVTDKPTVINLSHHGYWNLAGSQSIAGQHLHIHAQRRLVTNDIGIPVAIHDVPRAWEQSAAERGAEEACRARARPAGTGAPSPASAGSA